MKIFRRLSLYALFLLAASVAAPAAHADTATLQYLETADTGGVVWHYTFTLYNNSKSLDLYDVTFFWTVPSSMASDPFTLVSSPAGWIYSGPVAGSAEFMSMTPNPGGTDISPGSSLVGFNFDFAYKAGSTIQFSVLFSDGSSSPMASATAVPIPGTLLLFGSGLAGCVGLGRRFMKYR